MNEATPIRPSWWYSLLAIPFFLGGAGLFLYSMIHEILHITDSLTQVVIPGQAQLDLKRGQTYTVFFEQRSIVKGKIHSMDELPKGLECKVRSISSDDAIPITTPGMSTTYDIGGRSGRSILEFRVPLDGPYNFDCGYSGSASGPEAVLAVGSGVGAKIIRLVFQSLAGMFGGIGLGGLILLIIFVLREGTKNRLAAKSSTPFG